MQTVLHDILAAISSTHAEGVLPIVVFDLDGTLFITRHRTLGILAEFAERTGRPALAEVVAGISVEDQKYSVLSPLADRIALSETEKAALLAWWRGHFFTDEWCAKDTVMAGAVAFVNACHARGALVCYLTGRHIHGMEKGTVAALVDNGFPMFDGRAMLQLKPDFETADEPYKVEAIASIKGLGGRVIATFENEPGNANLFQEGFPGAKNLLVGHTHRPDAPPACAEVLHVEDFTL